MADRWAIAVGRFYEDLAARLVDGAERVFAEHGGEVDVYDVPGAFELPLAAKYCADSGRYAGVACLGHRGARGAEAQERQREADAVAAGHELLGEQHQPERPEKIQRPGNGSRDEQRGEQALRRARRALRGHCQIPLSLKYLTAPGW